MHCQSREGLVGQAGKLVNGRPPGCQHQQRGSAGDRRGCQLPRLSGWPLLLRQVVELKRAHPGVLLIVEVGYKYRFYGADAVAGGAARGSALRTSRHCPPAVACLLAGAR